MAGHIPPMLVAFQSLLIPRMEGRMCYTSADRTASMMRDLLGR